jgi:hypothetical protein
MTHFLVCAVLVLASASKADTTEAPSPQVGGHLGFALPLASWGGGPPTAIGRDFFQLGITPGVTLKLDSHWSIDFEFIAFSRWQNGSNSRTIWVADPGVLYNFGRVVVGLRAAMQIGQTIPFNFGLVPIVVVPFKISKRVSSFLEFDLPIFIFGGKDALSAATPSITPLFQTGFAF